MKIKTKFALVILSVSLVAITIAVAVSIYSINQRYKKIITSELEDTVRFAESNFGIYLSELNRKSYLLSEMKEVQEGVDHPEELASVLEFKNFYFLNTNIRILNSAKKIVLEKLLAAESELSENDLLQLPFFRQDRDPLLRDGLIVYIKDHLSFFSISPIVDQNTLQIKGFVLLETPVNLEFCEYLKSSVKAELFFLKFSHQLVSTLLDNNGQMIFPEEIFKRSSGQFSYPEKSRFVFATATISDFQEQNGLRMIVAVNFSELLHSRSMGVLYLLMVTTALALLMFITSFIAGQRISAPIVKLEEAAKAVASGNYAVQVAINRPDEIGSLAKNFNQMVESLLIQKNEIEKLKTFFEKMVDFSPLGILVGNDQEEIILANDSFKKLFAINADPVGMQLFNYFGFLKSLREDYLRVLFSGNVISYEAYQIFDQYHQERKMRLIISKIPLQDGPAVMMQFEDVSSRYELEEKLIHAQKLGSLGELLSKFTHEFNNLMTGLLGNLFILKNEFTMGSALYDRVQLVEEIALKAQNLGRDILNFSRKEKFKRELIDIGIEIDNVLGILSKTALKHLEIKKEFTETGLAVVVNKEKFSLSIFNILINARDAIESAGSKPGEIIIRLSKIRKDEKDFALIEIEDNGAGIEEKNLSRIFEPYFTTKGKKGTGLGLIQIKELVEENGGWIEVKSKVNRGTQFRIYLLMGITEKKSDSLTQQEDL